MNLAAWSRGAAISIAFALSGIFVTTTLFAYIIAKTMGNTIKLTDVLDRAVIVSFIVGVPVILLIMIIRRFYFQQLSPMEIDLLVDASPMHDIGKIGVPDHILLKPGKLTAEEFEIMKEHTSIGYKILSDTEFPLLRLASEIALTHHEKYDGNGYPSGLSGRDIPLSGRIVAVVDVFDALTSRRPYKEPFTNEAAYDIIRKGSGTHFDPDIVNLFFDVLPEIESIQNEYQDKE